MISSRKDRRTSSSHPKLFVFTKLPLKIIKASLEVKLLMFSKGDSSEKNFFTQSSQTSDRAMVFYFKEGNIYSLEKILKIF